MEVQIPGYIVQEESRLDIDFAEIALQYHLPIDGIVIVESRWTKPFFGARPGHESHDCHRQAPTNINHFLTILMLYLVITPLLRLNRSEECAGKRTP